MKKILITFLTLSFLSTVQCAENNNNNLIDRINALQERLNIQNAAIQQLILSPDQDMEEINRQLRLAIEIQQEIQRLQWSQQIRNLPNDHSGGHN